MTSKLYFSTYFLRFVIVLDWIVKYTVRKERKINMKPNCSKIAYTHFKVRKSLIVWTHWKSLSYTINGITWIGVIINIVCLVHCFGVKPKTEI